MTLILDVAIRSLMNLREIVDFRESYATVSREERNLVAILYSALLQGDNLQRFVDALGISARVEPSETPVFVEYAFLRDLWKNIDSNNDLKREAITKLLSTKDVLRLETATTELWNEHFGTYSRKEIRSPGKWSLKKFDKTISDRDEFLATCIFKWSFNIKPDLVVQVSRDQLIVLEAKIDSPEGKYPSDKEEIEIFRRRGLNIVRQTYLQEHMVENLLGYRSWHVQATPSGGPGKTRWAYLFEHLDLSGLPDWARTWIARY